MKRAVLAGLGALATVMTMTAAQAADMPRPQAMPTKAPAYIAPLYSWTGAYAGVNGGYGWGRSEWLSGGVSTGRFDTDGIMLGGTLGYNMQMGQFVAGLEGDIAWSDMNGDSSAGLCIGVVCETRNNWLGTARGRIGYAFNRVLPYVTGGVAVGDIEATPAGGASTTETKVGWTLGGGVEAAIAGPWSAKVEYLYADLGKGSCDTSVCGTPTDVDLTANIVRAGINFRF